MFQTLEGTHKALKLYLGNGAVCHHFIRVDECVQLMVFDKFAWQS